MSISKETKVGVLAAIAITLLIIGYNFLQGKNLFTSTNYYYGEYEQIEGLFASNPVLIRGYKVGSVSSVQMDNETLMLTVGIQLPNDIKVPANSTMKIVNYDMIGSKAIEIIFGDTTALAQSGDYLNATQDQGIAQAVSDVLTPLTKSIGHVLNDIDTAIAGADLESTLKDASIALRSFKETADKLNKLLDGKGEQIDAILTNVESTTRDLKGLSPKIDRILSDIDSTSQDIAAIEFEALANQIKSLATELEKTTSSINNSEGSLGLLVNDKQMYNDLDETIIKLKSLIEDIEKYPKRYFSLTSRGSKKANKEKEKAEAGN